MRLTLYLYIDLKTPTKTGRTEWIIYKQARKKKKKKEIDSHKTVWLPQFIFPSAAIFTHLTLKIKHLFNSEHRFSPVNFRFPIKPWRPLTASFERHISYMHKRKYNYNKTQACMFKVHAELQNHQGH